MDGKRTSFGQHKAWVDAGNPDVCRGCGALRPDDHRLWRGFKEKSLCSVCRNQRLRDAKAASKLSAAAAGSATQEVSSGSW